jgi:hypothetical protein
LVPATQRKRINSKVSQVASELFGESMNQINLFGSHLIHMLDEFAMIRIQFLDDSLASAVLAAGVPALCNRTSTYMALREMVGKSLFSILQNTVYYLEKQKSFKCSPRGASPPISYRPE